MIDLAKQIANRRIEDGVRFELVTLRLEPALVLEQIIAEIIAVEALMKLIGEEVSGTFAERTREKIGID